MADQWHYSRDGQQFGPVSGGELRQLVAHGGLSPTDLIWRDGLADWVPASRIKGLFPQTPPPLPIAPGANQPSSPPPTSAGLPSMPSSHGHPGSTPVQIAVADSANAPPIATIFAGMHRQRLAIAIAAAAGMLATFLPWYHVPLAGAVTGSRGDGWITFFLFLPAAVLCFTGDRSRSLTSAARLGGVIPAVIASLVAVISAVGNKSAERKNPLSAALMEATDIGIGIFLVVAAGIAVLVFAWSLAKSTTAAGR